MPAANFRLVRCYEQSIAAELVVHAGQLCGFKTKASSAEFVGEFWLG